jgi:hypothetical protein
MWAGRCPSALGRGRDAAHRIPTAASAAPAETEEAGARPPCYKELWIAPSPSRLVNDKRVFVEEHR